MAEYIVDQSKYTNMTMRYEIANGHERIVRCRDCKHYECADEVCNRFGDFPSAIGTWFEVNRDGFCAWGEPKEGANV